MPYDREALALVVQLQMELVLHALAEGSKLRVFAGHASNANARLVLAVVEEHVDIGVLAGSAVVRNEGEVVRAQAVFERFERRDGPEHDAFALFLQGLRELRPVQLEHLVVTMLIDALGGRQANFRPL